MADTLDRLLSGGGLRSERPERFFVPHSVMDRPYAAGRQVLRGDIRGTLTALVDPQRLSPYQLGESKSPIEDALRAAVPLVAAGAILSMRFPIGSVRKFARRLLAESSKYTSPTLPVLNRFQDIHSLFEGTRFGKRYLQLLDDVRDFKHLVWQRVSEGFSRFMERAGRSPSMAEQVATAMAHDNLISYGHPVWQLLRDRTRRILYQARYGMTLPQLQKVHGADFVDDAIEEFVGRIGQVSLYDIEQLSSPELLEAGRRAAAESFEKILIEEEGLKRLVQLRLRKEGPKARRWAKRVREALQTIHEGDLKKIQAMLDKHGIELPELPLNASKAQRQAWLQEARKRILAGWRPDYFPHVRATTFVEYEEAAKKALRRELDIEPGERYLLETLYDIDPRARQAVREAGATPLTGPARIMENRMLPAVEDLRFLPRGTVSDETIEALAMFQLDDEMLRRQALARIAGGYASEIPVPKFEPYSLRYAAVWERYGHSMGRTYGWVVRGHGPALLEEIHGPMREQANYSGAARLRLHLAREKFLPIAMAQLSPSETFYTLQWGALKKATHEFFGQERVRKLIGTKTAEWFQRQLERPSIQNLTLRNMGAKIAGWFYYSTLGLNPASAGLNLMQNLMTTTGVVPMKHVAEGFRRMAEGQTRFLKYLSDGMQADRAWAKAFPEWEKLVGVSEPGAVEILREARLGASPVAQRLEKGKKLLMRLFTYSERTNKMWAYYAGRSWAEAEKVKPEIAHLVGKRVLEITQFPGGPAHQPILTLNWWAPFRQFTQFPLKTLGLFTKGWEHGDFGTMGRMLMASGAVYGAGRALGLNLSRGLIFGAMPTPQDPDQPFYPLPIVPPFLQLVGGTAADIMEGSLKHTQRNIPLLIPGGVALARASTAILPGVAKLLGRRYVDYEHPRPDGTYPVYSASGNLLGFETPLQIWARALGWRSLTGDPEGELAAYLLKHRDQMRAYHREYVEALARNDMEEAAEINRRYQEQYNLGPIQVSPADLRAIELRHQVSRLERILETMPATSRAEFGAYVTAALGDMAEQFMGVNPELLRLSETRTIRSRIPGRRAWNTSLRQRLQQYLPGSGSTTDILSPLRQDQLGSQPKLPFTAFEGFSDFNQ